MTGVTQARGTRTSGSRRWRGAPNDAPTRAQRRGSTGSPASIGGTIRWIDRERKMIYLRVDETGTSLRHWIGHLVGLDLTKARTRFDLVDRDADRRIDLGDVTLGDRVDAAATSVPAAPNGTVRATRVLIRAAS